MSVPQFTWGDVVRVSACAPAEVRPGECGDVVAVTEIDSQQKAELYDAPLGSTVYQVEFGDGHAVEVRDTWLERATTEG